MKTTLYKKNKNGSLQVWHTWVEGYEVFTEYGRLDGKMQTTSKKCRRKNVGKENELSAHESALSEMESKISKQIDKNYFHSIEEAQDESNNTILPMLAQSFDKHSDKIDYPAMTQIKLDGVRALLIDGKFYSRGGKEYKVMRPLAQEISLFVRDGVILDGELYCHDLTFQEIISAVKKDGGNTPLIQYYNYDCYFNKMTDMVAVLRMEYINTLREQNIGNFVVVPTNWVRSKEDIKRQEEIAIQNGYEGLIVRNSNAVYELNSRSYNLQKVKTFQEEEFEIVGYTEGVGNHKGCIIFICKTDMNRTFNVTPKMPLDKRKELYANGDSKIGKLLTVEFFEWTTNDPPAPRFPIGKAIRDYE